MLQSRIKQIAEKQELRIENECHVLPYNQAEEEKQLLIRALERYGVDNQLMLMQEELAEAITAISHFRRKRQNGMSEVAEELADVSIVLDQLKNVFGEEIELWREKKLNKLRSRLNNY